MDQRELVRAIAERTTLSREESADVTRAVLEGLAGQLSESEARRLVTDLPGPLADQVDAQPRRKNQAHPMDADDFVRLVSEHTGLTDVDARAGTAAVLDTLRQELSQEAYRHLTAQLPAGYTRLGGSA
jgi:uncharacterized protein (DUF2267 family)